MNWNWKEINDLLKQVVHLMPSASDDPAYDLYLVRRKLEKIYVQESAYDKRASFPLRQEPK